MDLCSRLLDACGGQGVRRVSALPDELLSLVEEEPCRYRVAELPLDARSTQQHARFQALGIRLEQLCELGGLGE